MSPPNSTSRIIFFIYRLLWLFMVPLLRFHKRMKIGYGERTLKRHLPKADLWIQAASVGEAFIVEEILLSLSPTQPLVVLVTTNTSQGMDILRKITPGSQDITLKLRYCPFDRPDFMDRAIAMVAPSLVVLIETELWPGLLRACKKGAIKVCVINGRMTEKSMQGYLRLSQFWKDIAPTTTLAMSEADGERYSKVFDRGRTSIMTNIKFDRLLRTATDTTDSSPLSAILAPDVPFVVLGSTRSEEEELVGQMIKSLFHHNPKLVIGLFPRHMERISAWQQHLQKDKIPVQLRSEISEPVQRPTVILWDRIGELQQGYRRADAAFVGGSLAPLGGQNFLEAMTAGLQPVIGQSWSNFYWVGEDIFKQNLAIRVDNWQEAVNVLLNCLKSPTDRNKVQQTFRQYAKKQEGGTTTACNTINNLLQD